jgi:hypothetical protein
MNRAVTWASSGVVAALLQAGCAGGAASGTGSPPDPEPTPALRTAPQSARVDLAEPAFSDPTSISNPLFPISALGQVIQVGSESGAPLRHEVTLLPRTRVIAWNGREVETLVSQFVAYRDERILEVAYDYFAQADDGSVWYFGEDVDNYEDGVIADHEGTWLAGRDGPPGMIMPASPEVGDVYRPENIPGLVFEEVTVKSVSERVDGPSGPVDRAILVEELLLDGTLEDKIFAPGYGEFRAEVITEDELVTVSVATPVDTVPGEVPQDLRTLSCGSFTLLASGDAQDWEATSVAHAGLATAWERYRAGGLPPLTQEQLGETLIALGAAVRGREVDEARRAATQIANATLDLQLRHRPTAEVDMGRLSLHTRQLLADAAAREAGFVAGDAAALATIWHRAGHAVDEPVRADVDAQLADLRSAVDAGDLDAATTAAASLQTVVEQTYRQIRSSGDQICR